MVSYMCRVQDHVLSMMDDATCRALLRGVGHLLCDLFLHALPDKVCTIGYHQILINIRSLEIAWGAMSGVSCGVGVSERMDTREILHCLRERLE